MDKNLIVIDTVQTCLDKFKSVSIRKETVDANRRIESTRGKKSLLTIDMMGTVPNKPMATICCIFCRQRILKQF